MKTLKIVVFSLIPFLILLLICEFFVFKFILPASEWPYRRVIKSPDELVRFLYKESGIHKSGITRALLPEKTKVRYNINSDGWNSPKEYSKSKTQGIRRIAIIGDSFVEAIQVDVDKSFAEILEKELIKSNINNIEVYRFGVSGAALSQYLQMMHYVKKEYNPDIVIVTIINNDFLESIQGFGNQQGDLLQFKRKNNSWVEVRPTPNSYSSNLRLIQFFKHSSTFRYFYGNLGGGLKIKELMRSLKRKNSGEKKYSMDINIKDIEEKKELLKDFLNYIFAQYKTVLGPQVKLLLVMDTDRKAIYSGNDPKTILHTITLEAAKKHSIPFLDLTKAFSLDFKKNKQKFEFKYDWHWNERGHKVVGEAIAGFILNSILL